MSLRGRQIVTAAAPRALRPQTEMSYGAAPEDASSTSLSLSQILTIAVAYWKPAVAIALTVSLIAAVGVKFMSKTYTATATLIVNTDNKDPLAGQQGPNDALGNYVATQTELMLSPVILLPVVDRLGLANNPAETAGLKSSDPTARREYVEKALADKVQIETGRGGQLLYVLASARDPVQASDIANAVADEYLLQQRKRISQPAGERAQRYSEELAELRDKAAAAQDKVTEFRKKNGITDVAVTNEDSEVQALSNLQGKLLEAQSQRRAIESKETGEQSNAAETLASPQVTVLKGQISDLEAQLAQKESTLGVRHPQVMELQSRLNATRSALAQEIESLSRNNVTEASRARALEEKLARAVADQREKVLNLHEVQGEGQKLTLELESAQAVYKRALDGYDQIMFASVGNYTNVSIIDRATPPLKASKPNKVKLLGMAIMFGLALGLAIPIAYELFVNRRIRCRDDIERSCGVPVLAQFDVIPPAPNPT